MNIRNVTAALALGLGALATPSIGQTAVLEFDIGVAPPPERVEVVPAPRAGYIYEPGHYTYDGQKYVWAEGRFFRNREGRTWHPYVFERRGDSWHFRAGHWDDE